MMISTGKSNVIAGLASAMRHYFQRHPLVKVGVKGRAEGTPVAEIVQQIEVFLHVFQKLQINMS